MQAGIIIRGFIASPSDVEEERRRALDVVTKWNAVNSLDREMVIEAVRVDTHAESQVGRHPQEIINGTLLERCDCLIAVFYSKLGTPTEKEVSGTVDEIKTFAEAKSGEMVKLFFSERDCRTTTIGTNSRGWTNSKRKCRASLSISPLPTKTTSPRSCGVSLTS